MMIRQTFYISQEVSQQLKKLALKYNKKISALVNEALRKHLASFKNIYPRTHSLLSYAGNISSFKNSDPITVQKQLRTEWEKS